MAMLVQTLIYIQMCQGSGVEEVDRWLFKVSSDPVFL